MPFRSFSSLLPILFLLFFPACSTPPPPAPFGATPAPRQLAWHQLEYYAFVHFNMNTFTDLEWGHGTEGAQNFNPSQLDCRQWARIASQAGMKGIILTAKHHDGFCLWPTAYSDHNISKSPWKDGQGDVLRELSDACKEYGLKFGVYLSPWDRFHPDYGSEAYNEVFKNQLREVLSNYGEVFEVWFDGANGEGPNGKKQVYDWPAFRAVVRELQPDAVMFSDGGPDIRWVGNEKGYAGETNWATLNRDEFYPGIPGKNDRLEHGDKNGSHWLPAEVDVSIRPGWYYHADEDERVKSLDQLVDIYHHSVGRNANLLLNLPVDRRGLVHENDSARLMQLRAVLEQTYTRDLAQEGKAKAHPVRGGNNTYAGAMAIDNKPDTYWATDDGVTQGTLEITLKEPRLVDRVLLQEYITLGQRVDSFSLEAHLGQGWQTVAQGTTIGYKRILRFPALRSDRLRLHIHAALASPLISTLALYCGGPQVSFDPEPNSVFSDSMEVNLYADFPQAEIYFSLDGSQPSQRYEHPLVLSGATTVHAVATAPGYPQGISQEATYYYQPFAMTASYATAYSPRYPGGGEMALVNGVTGSEDFRDGKWQGFYEDDLEVVLDLGQNRPLNQVSVSFLHDENSWIFSPVKVEIQISEDGKSYSPLFASQNDVYTSGSYNRNGHFIRTFSVKPKATKGRYLKVWAQNMGKAPTEHPGAGDKVWLFVDEVIVK